MFGTGAAIFSILLLITGAAKIRSPHDIARALGAFGLPVLASLGVTIGVVEIVVGATAMLMPAMLWAQGALYAAFAVWVLLALRRDVPIASCGCLGKEDTPPTGGHLLMNLMAAGLSGAAAREGGPVLLGGLAGVAQTAVVAGGVFLAYIVLTDGARLVGVRGR